MLWGNKSSIWRKTFGKSVKILDFKAWQRIQPIKSELYASFYYQQNLLENLGV